MDEKGNGKKAENGQSKCFSLFLDWVLTFADPRVDNVTAQDLECDSVDGQRLSQIVIGRYVDCRNPNSTAARFSLAPGSPGRQTHVEGTMGQIRGDERVDEKVNRSERSFAKMYGEN